MSGVAGGQRRQQQCRLSSSDSRMLVSSDDSVEHARYCASALRRYLILQFFMHRMCQQCSPVRRGTCKNLQEGLGEVARLEAS